MWNRISCLSIGAVLLGFLLVSLTPAQAETNDSNLLVRAQEEFSQGLFIKSLVSFRAYLRKEPDDQDAWTRFAAAYYHTGQAGQALEYLQKSRPSSSLRSFNTYYRALSYDALGESERALRLLSRLSKSDDSLAEAALFEKAAIQFALGDAGASKVSAEEYKRRYRNGRFRPSIDFILERLDQPGKAAVPEAQRTLYVQNFFRTHPLALIDTPHSWAYQLGYEYALGERKNPASEPGAPLLTKPFEEHRLLAKAAFTLGPYVTNTTKSYFGYVYAQSWESDNERLNYSRTYPADLEFFPFRPDLMERSHRLLVDSQARTGPFGAGVYAHLDLKRGGSELFPAPERPEIKTSFSIGTNTLVAPYAEWFFLDDHKLRFSAFFEKFIDTEQSDFSFKTFNISNGFDDPFVSFSLMQESQWKIWGAVTQFEFFRWVYLYNDFWEGYTSTGGAGSLRFVTPSFDYLPSLVLGGRFSYSNRDYTSELIKTGPCSDKAVASPAFEEETSPISTCLRSESYMVASGFLSYVGRMKQNALSVAVDYRARENATLTVYDESTLSFLFIFTQAFPQLDQGARNLEPPRGLQYQRITY